MQKTKTVIYIKGSPVKIQVHNNEEYICITDIAKTGTGNHHDIVKNYLKNGNNISFLSLWEEMTNEENFNSEAAKEIKLRSIDNNFTLSVKSWIAATNAIGIMAKVGKYGGTYAHKDIAVHFSTWLSPEAYLYMVKEFQRLKEEEASKTARIESTRNWIFEKVIKSADELNSIALLGIELNEEE